MHFATDAIRAWNRRQSQITLAHLNLACIDFDMRYEA